VFTRPYYLDERVDSPEQYRVIDWVGDRLFMLIFEVREDKRGDAAMPLGKRAVENQHQLHGLAESQQPWQRVFEVCCVS
jgi:CelD/BcsL family acetyltransferase involved in cellulose biosynthesis